MKMNKKGFTLAELLVVVAIIAVLVAISIPVFSAQTEKAKEGVDLANLRSAYAECASAAVADGASYYKEVTLTQGTAGWATTGSVGGIQITANSPSSGTVYVNVSSTGAASITAGTAASGYTACPSASN